MKKRNILVAVLLAILIFSVITFLILNNQSEENKVKEPKIVDKLDAYGYSLEANSTSYYKELFEKLREILENSEVDSEKYARLVSQLFVSDLFTLTNKVNSRDIGGIQFVHKDFEKDFIKIEQNGLYSNIESNVYGDREQKLPEVTLVNIDSIEKTTFDYNNISYDGYLVTVSIQYKEDLSYPDKCTLTLIKNKNRMDIVKLK